MQYPRSTFVINPGPRPNRPSDVTVTYFDNPHKFWIRRIRSTDNMIGILETIREKCSSNNLKRPSKINDHSVKKECKGEVFCSFHEQTSPSKGCDHAIIWKLPEDPHDPHNLFSQELLKRRGLKKGDVVYARSRYIQNRETNLYECCNRVIIQTAYQPEEYFLNVHVLVQFMDEEENHTEWIPISDISPVSRGDVQLFDDITLFANDITEEFDNQNDAVEYQSKSSNLFASNYLSEEAATDISSGDATIDNHTPLSDNEESLPQNEFEYVDDNIYCGKLSDFGLLPGCLILARCTQIKDTSPFYRGKIVNMKFQRILGLHLQIFFHDYGNTEWVHILDTRTMPEELLEIPPLAEEASLHHLYPTWIFEPDEEPTDHGWSRAACKEFTKMVSKCELPNLSEDDSPTYIDLFNNTEEYYAPNPLLLQVFETRARKQYVDLLHCPIDEGGVSKGDLVSVRDMILYLGLGCMSDPRKMEPIALLPQATHSLPSLGSIRGFYEEGSFSVVRISHVESAHEVYVQPIQHIKSTEKKTLFKGTTKSDVLLQRIGKELELFYDPIYNSNPYVIIEPIVGSLCAVKRYGIPGHRGSENDVRGRRWYRCMIENVANNTRLITVFLVDVGCRYITTTGKYLYLLNLDRFVHKYRNALCFPIRMDNVVFDNTARSKKCKTELADALEKVLSNYDTQNGSNIDFISSCMGNCSLEEAKDVLNNHINTVFVMHIVENNASFENRGNCRDSEIEEYPSANLFHQTSSGDRLDFWQPWEPNKNERRIICINSLLGINKYVTSQAGNNTSKTTLINQCDNLNLNEKKGCSHPVILGSFLQWMHAKLEEAHSE